MRLTYYRDLILVLTQKEMQVRYKNTFLGYLWSVAQPLALAFVFFVAFKVVMRINVPNYTLFLITALFPWQWFSNSVTSANGVFIGNASIIKKINFPRYSLVIANICQDSIHFFLAIPALLIFMLYYRIWPHWSWFYGIPVLFVIQFITTFGLSLIVASLNLFFRDLERLTSIFVMLLFYCTPIIYPADMIPEKFRCFLNFNPVAPLMVNWRNLFLEGHMDVFYMLISLLYGLGFMSLGVFIYKKLSYRFAEVL